MSDAMRFIFFAFISLKQPIINTRMSSHCMNLSFWGKWHNVYSKIMILDQIRAELKLLLNLWALLPKCDASFFVPPKSVSERTKSINIIREQFMMIKCVRYRKNRIKYIGSSTEPYSIAQHISKYLNNKTSVLRYKIQNPKCKFTFFSFTLQFLRPFSIETPSKPNKKEQNVFEFMWYLQENLHIYSFQSSTKCYTVHTKCKINTDIWNMGHETWDCIWLHCKRSWWAYGVYFMSKILRTIQIFQPSDINKSKIKQKGTESQVH